MTQESATLLAQREGGVYAARNERGATVRIGAPGEPDSFTPGELLHLALASCAAVSADHVLASRLGADFAASLTVTAQLVDEEERYAQIDARLAVDAGELPEERVAALVGRADRAIERLCTVGRTLAHGADYSVDVVAAT